MGSILDTAKALTGAGGDRREAYQHPLDDFTATGEAWSALLHKAGLMAPGTTIPPELVAVMMVTLKQVRLAGQLDHLDSIVDTAGYAACHEMVILERARREMVEHTGPRWGIRDGDNWLVQYSRHPDECIWAKDLQIAMHWKTEEEANQFLSDTGFLGFAVDELKVKL